MGDDETSGSKGPFEVAATRGRAIKADLSLGSIISQRNNEPLVNVKLALFLIYALRLYKRAASVAWGWKTLYTVPGIVLFPQQGYPVISFRVSAMSSFHFIHMIHVSTKTSRPRLYDIVSSHV